MHEARRKRINHLIDDIAFFRDLENDYEDECMSAELKKLEENALDLLNNTLSPEIAPVNVAIIGNFSCGKSTFINSLIGADVCPTRINPTTSSITKFLYGEKAEIFQLEEGEYVKLVTHDEYFTMCQHQKGSTKNTETYELHYYYPFDILKTISIFDTPGFKNRQNPNDQLVTEKIALDADVVFLLVDANNSSDIDADLEDILEDIAKKNTNLRWYYVLNRCDEKTKTATQKLLNHAKEKYDARFDDFFAYSAMTAFDELDVFNKHSKNVEPEKIVEIGSKLADKISGILDELKIGNNDVYKQPYNNFMKSIKNIFNGKEENNQCASRDHEKIIEEMQNTIQSFRSTLLQIVDHPDSNALPEFRFLETRQQIIDTMAAIGRSKNKIKLKNYNTARATYDGEVFKSLENIRKQNHKHKSNNYNNDHFGEFEKFSNKFDDVFADDIEATAHQYAKIISNLLNVRDMTKDEKSYWFIPYAIIVLNNKVHSEYKLISNKFNELIDDIIAQYTNVFPYMHGKITKNKIVKDEIKEKLSKNKHDLIESFKIKYDKDTVYDDKDAALNAIEIVRVRVFEAVYKSLIEIFVDAYHTLKEEIKLLANTHSTELMSKTKIFGSVDQKISDYLILRKERSTK